MWHLRQALAALEAAGPAIRRRLELGAEELGWRPKLRPIAGAIDAEEVLGAILSEFCIGK